MSDGKDGVVRSRGHSFKKFMEAVTQASGINPTTEGDGGIPIPEASVNHLKEIGVIPNSHDRDAAGGTS